jgi:hypothetical protein
MGKIEGKRPLGIHRLRGEDDIKIYFIYVNMRDVGANLSVAG